MGRKPSKFPSKTDCHPRKPYVNWWEYEICNDENKKGERQKVKNEIKKEYYGR